jgi:hypothetical protein
VIEGFFGAMWFGWAQNEPPDWLVPVLVVGTVLCVALAVGGAVVAWRSPDDSSPMADPRVRRQYGITVGIEFAVIFVGAALLGALDGQQYIAAWIAAVVGIHFVPLGRFFGERLLQISGVLITVVALVAAIVAATQDVDSSTVAGAGTGLLLLLTGLLTLAGVRVPGAANPAT